MNTKTFSEADLRLASEDVPASTPVWIEVDLSAIKRNLQEIKRFVGPRVKILSVIKANAYGHGLAPVARALADAGADLLAVASVLEGLKLREQGIDGKILVLGQLLPEEAPLVVQHCLTQAIGDEQSAFSLSDAAAELGRPADVHLKVDTGMSRYGVWWEDAVSLTRKITELPGLKIGGILTHLAMAGQNTDATQDQLERFKSVIQELEQKNLPAGLRHAANSVGLLKFSESHWDLVRTGLLVYGASPLKEDVRKPFPLKPALSLKSRIRFLKTVPAGRGVSYGGTFQASRPTVVATVPVGYAHGYPRALSNRAQVLVRGRRALVIGKITMEDLMVDVTDVPGVSIGDEVVLIGRQGNEQITAEELARQARTIPYEILAGLSPGILRRYAA